MDVISKFIDKAKISGITPFFPPNVALLVIEECKVNKIPIYGIDAVKITGTYTEPSMEHSVDYSSVENIWGDAIQFIKSKEHLNLHFEIVIPRNGSETLTFVIQSKPKISAKELERMHITDALYDERDFSISVNGQIFFCQPHFPMLEFAQYCQQWLKKPGKDFVYNTIESDENPLIAFYKQKDVWRLESVWKKFECNEIFSDNDVMNFVKEVFSHIIF